MFDCNLLHNFFIGEKMKNNQHYLETSRWNPRALIKGGDRFAASHALAGHALVRYVLALGLGSLSASVVALDFKLGEEISGKLSGTATAGTTIRTESADPAVLGIGASARVGGPAGQLGGNAGVNDLNFQKNRPVSTVIKTIFDLELKWQNFGLFARAKAWHDFELDDGSRAYGNATNGFARNVPLSDNGFDPAAKFSNIQLADVYVFGKFQFEGDKILDTKFGRQVLNWGAPRLVSGGIEAIDARDIPAQVRPGALLQEGRVPSGMLYANLAGGKQWGVEGFAQYEFRPMVLSPCGTFYTPINYSPTGCNYASVLAALDDATALSTERYVHRSADIKAKDSGQFGISLRYFVGALSTEFRGYAMNYHSRTPSLRAINPNIAGGFGVATTTRLSDPNGLKYAVTYPSDIHLYGVSFGTSLDPTTRIYGEYAYRPNQPLTLNVSDLIGAFVGRAPTSLLNIAKNTNAIPVGGIFDAYDRYKVTTASLGATKVLPKMWGAERLILLGELGWSHVNGLPDPGVLRYGRLDAYGGAAINGQACVDATAAQKSCAHDGFVTPNAWGYRLRVSADYPGAFFGAVVTPSVLYAKDVSGYSYDGSFLQDRQNVVYGIRAEWNRKYFGDIQYTRISGGAYNIQSDMDRLTLVAGVNF
ncbi:MAG: DUF1302 domain-containing protein [Burkholderiales bacterium]